VRGIPTRNGGNEPWLGYFKKVTGKLLAEIMGISAEKRKKCVELIRESAE